MKTTTMALGILCGMADLLDGCRSDPAKVTPAPAPAHAPAPAPAPHDAAPFNPTSE